MKTTSDKVKQEIHIDEYNLQKEWLRQSNLVIKYAGLAAKTRKKRDLMDRKIAVRRSQVNILARENPADFFPKPPDRITESLIESAIELDKDYNSHQNERIKLEYRYQIYRNVVDALADKRKALECIQELILSGLYAEPKDKAELEIRKTIQQKGGRK